LSTGRRFDTVHNKTTLHGIDLPVPDKQDIQSTGTHYWFAGQGSANQSGNRGTVISTNKIWVQPTC